MSKALPNRLKEIRLKKKKTLQDVSNATGISPSHICYVEHAHGNSSTMTMCILADYYGVGLDTILGRKPGEKYIKD